MSVRVSHHLWQLLLSLTTLSAQEVISELDYHRQPYSVVSPPTHTHIHTQQSSIWTRMDKYSHFLSDFHIFVQTDVLFHTLHATLSLPPSLTREANISLKNIHGSDAGSRTGTPLYARKNSTAEI